MRKNAPGTVHLGKVQEVFDGLFGHIPVTIPDDDIVYRRKGSLPYGSGRIFYLFGSEAGREYLEYYAHHRIAGDSHGRIYDDGEHVALPELESGFFYSPDIPGDRERKEAERAEQYQKTLDELHSIGMFSSGPVPGSLVMRSALMEDMVQRKQRPEGEEGDTSHPK